MTSSIANTNSFICTQLNGFESCNVTQIVLLNITYLFGHSKMVLSIVM